MIQGRWHWNHDGVQPNGDIALYPGGIIAHECGWSGGKWSIMPDGEVKLVFNGITHYMVLAKSQKQMVLTDPPRYPASTATWKGPL